MFVIEAVKPPDIGAKHDQPQKNFDDTQKTEQLNTLMNIT